MRKNDYDIATFSSSESEATAYSSVISSGLPSSVECSQQRCGSASSSDTTFSSPVPLGVTSASVEGSQTRSISASSSATISRPVSFQQCPTCYEIFPQEDIESHADACAEAWVDPIGDIEQSAETQSEEEIEESIDNSEDAPEVNLEAIKTKLAT